MSFTRVSSSTRRCGIISERARQATSQPGSQPVAARTRNSVVVNGLKTVLVVIMSRHTSTYVQAHLHHSTRTRISIVVVALEVLPSPINYSVAARCAKWCCSWAAWRVDTPLLDLASHRTTTTTDPLYFYRNFHPLYYPFIPPAPPPRLSSMREY